MSGPDPHTESKGQVTGILFALILLTFDPKNILLFLLSWSTWFHLRAWLRSVCTCQHTLWGFRTSDRRPPSSLKSPFSSSCGDCSTNHDDCWRLWAWLTGSWLPWPQMNFNFLLIHVGHWQHASYHTAAQNSSSAEYAHLARVFIRK